MFQTTRGRHGAPRASRRWFARTRPACGPIPVPVLAEAPVVPSMDLPDGHMAQRPEKPSPVYVGTVLRQQRSGYRKGDEVVVTGGLHLGRHGIVESAYGAGRLVVDVEGGIVYLDEDHVRLVRRPVDADTETFPPVEVPVSVVEVTHVGPAAIGHWLPAAPVCDTLTMDAVLDDAPLMGGVAR